MYYFAQTAFFIDEMKFLLKKGCFARKLFILLSPRLFKSNQNLTMIIALKFNKHMKTQLMLSVAVGFLLMLIGNTSTAQTTAAVLSEAGILQLPTDQPVKSTYIVDISALEISDEEELKAFFETRSNDLITYRVMASEAKAVLMIHRSKRAEWTIIDWNTYLLEQTTINPIRN